MACPKRRIAYDTVLKRPGCVLLQAVMGGTVDVAKLFPAGQWVIEPTPNLKVYEVTEEQLQMLVEITEGK